MVKHPLSRTRGFAAPRAQASPAWRRWLRSFGPAAAVAPRGGCPEVLEPRIMLAVQIAFEGQNAVFNPTTIAALVTADLNADGRPDVIVADFTDNGSGGNAASTIQIYLNNTTSGATSTKFGAATAFTVDTGPQALAVADFNGDGKPDIAVLCGTGQVSILVNQTANGSKTLSFVAQQKFAFTTNPLSIAAGDINGDGLADLIVSEMGTFPSSSFTARLNNTAAGSKTLNFAAASKFSLPGIEPRLVVGDFNTDGKIDVAALVLSDDVAGTSSVAVSLNTTPGGAATPAFAAATSFGTIADAAMPVAVDLDADSMLDVVVVGGAGSGSVTWLRNTTAPGAATPGLTPQTMPGFFPVLHNVAAGDLNNDGLPDLGTASDDGLTTLGTSIVGGTVSLASTSFFAGTAVEVSLADLNTDGRLDAIVHRANIDFFSPLLNITTLPALKITDNLGSAADNTLEFPETLFPNPSSTTGIFTLANTSKSAVNVTSFVLGNTADYAATVKDQNGQVVADPAAGFTIPAGAAFTVEVTFAPSVIGTLVTSLDLATSDAGNPFVSLAITGKSVTPPVLAITDSSDITDDRAVTLPNTAIGSTSAAATFTLTNSGLMTLAVTDFAISGPDAAEFQITIKDNQGDPVAGPDFGVPGGAAYTIEVVFAPQSLGTKTGQITFSTNDDTLPTATLTFTGDSVEPPTLAVTDNSGAADDLSATLADTAVGGQTTTPAIFTLTNAGGTALTITNIALGGPNANDFQYTVLDPAGEEVTDLTDGLTIDPGAAYTIRVVMVPLSRGAKTAEITFDTNDPNQPAATLAFSGMALLPPTLVVTDNSGNANDFSVTLPTVPVGETSAPARFTLTNTGEMPLHVTAFRLGGLTPGSFQLTVRDNNGVVVANPGAFTIPENGAAFTIDVVMSPAFPGPKSAQITFNTDDPTRRAVTLNLNGNALVAPMLLISDSTGAPLDRTAVIPDTGVGLIGDPAVFTIRNLTLQPIAFTNLTVNGDQAAEFVVTVRGQDGQVITDRPFDLTAGATYTIAVALQPLLVGAKAATITFNTIDPNNDPVTLTVTGLARPAGFGVTDTSGAVNDGIIAFPDMPAGVTSAGHTFTITNTGLATLAITNLTVNGGANYVLVFRDAQGNTIADPTNLNILGGQSATIEARFQPTSAGALPASITFNTNAPGNGFITLNLAGTGLLQPALVITDNAEPEDDLTGTYPITLAGFSSGPVVFTLTNLGLVPLTITGLTLGGADPGDFALTVRDGEGNALNADDFSIPAATAYTLEALFTPAASGDKSASVSFTTDDPAAPAVTLNVMGSAVDSALLITDDSGAPGDLAAELPETVTGTAGAPATFSLTNIGPVPIFLTDVVASSTDMRVLVRDPLGNAVGSANFAVPAGATYLLLAYLHPASAGAKTGTVTFTTSDSALPLATLALTGNAITPATVAVTDDSGATGDLSAGLPDTQVGALSIPITFTLANTGTQALEVTGLTLAGQAAAEYQIVVRDADGVPVAGDSFTIAGGAAFTIEVRFTPLTPDLKLAAINFQTNDPEAPIVSLGLAGHGRLPARLAVTDSDAPADDRSATLPVTATGLASAPAAFTLTNIGQLALQVSALTLAGADAADFVLNVVDGQGQAVVGPAFSIPAGAAYTLLASLAPATAGAKTAQIIFSTNDADNAAVVLNLTGTAVPPSSLAITDDSGDSSDRAIDTLPAPTGTVSPPATFTLANTGNTAITITGLALGGDDPDAFRLTLRDSAGNAVALGNFAIAPGDFFTLEVRLTPGTAGAKSARVTFASSDPADANVTLELAGPALAAIARARLSLGGRDLVPGSSVGFGSATVAGKAPVRAVRVTNTGNVALRLNRLRLPTGFALVGKLPAKVRPGESVLLRIRLLTNTPGTFQGQLRLLTNDSTRNIFPLQLRGKVS